jgi:hypothetical protein
MTNVAMLTNFERLREIIKTRKPERLEAFDAYIHRKKAAIHPDDDLWMVLELIEFHSEIRLRQTFRSGSSQLPRPSHLRLQW